MKLVNLPSAAFLKVHNKKRSKETFGGTSISLLRLTYFYLFLFISLYFSSGVLKSPAWMVTQVAMTRNNG